MHTKLLDGIQNPEDLKKLDIREMEQLCGEIRDFLIDSVSKTGGHLSSNLGMVELTVALHRVLNSPQDMLVFDVGHQCYTHKLLTGRKDAFATLRQEGGLSGFPSPRESVHDVFLAGHGSTAISAAVGLASAKKLKGEAGCVVAIVGDGAFTGGMVYEGLNNVGQLDNLIIILNDNKMSISKNVGALAHYFTNLRTSTQYYKAKSDVKTVLDNTPLIGQGLIRTVQSVKSGLRRSIYHSTFFEEMGLQYMGPIDGHSLPELLKLFVNLKNIQKPLFIHVETVKGKGFKPAENNPGAFHGVSAFDANHITDPDVSPQDSFSTQFGKALADLAKANPAVCGITAAMKYGTGLQYIKKAFPARFFDVGMAEEHAVTFAAGLARGGMAPVLAIYSTFLQRGYDQLIHDIMLQNLNVLLAIDRAGLVPGDGETHQGIYDAAYLSQQPGLLVVSPANYAELRHWLQQLVENHHAPRALRYPRGREHPALASKPCSGNAFDKIYESPGAQVALVTYGAQTAEVLSAAKGLALCDVKADAFQLVVINPLPDGLVAQLLRYKAILFAEEGIVSGGIGEHLAAALQTAGFKGAYRHIGVPPTGNDHASVEQLRRANGLDEQNLVRMAQELLP